MLVEKFCVHVLSLFPAISYDIRHTVEGGKSIKRETKNTSGRNQRPFPVIFPLMYTNGDLYLTVELGIGKKHIFMQEEKKRGKQLLFDLKRIEEKRKQAARVNIQKRLI